MLLAYDENTPLTPHDFARIFFVIMVMLVIHVVGTIVRIIIGIAVRRAAHAAVTHVQFANHVKKTKVGGQRKRHY